MVEDEHYHDRGHDGDQVTDDNREVVVLRGGVGCGGDVPDEGAAVKLALLFAFDDRVKFVDVEVLEDVETEAQTHEDAWDDDVS